MTVAEYSLTDGFRDVDPELNPRDGEAIQEWIERIGFIPDSARPGPWMQFIPREGFEYAALIRHQDLWGLVKTPAAVVKLRLELKPAMLAGQILETIRTALAAWHAHDAGSACPLCDPEAFEAENRAAEDLRRLGREMRVIARERASR